jgi:hypothetical protein
VMSPTPCAAPVTRAVFMGDPCEVAWIVRQGTRHANMSRTFFKDGMSHDSAIHLALQRHSSTPSRAVRGVHFALSLAANDAIQLEFDIDAAVDAVVVPAPKPRALKDGLWRHTCFELFAGGADGAYREFNFSPSTEFAIYDFADYRAAMTPLSSSETPSIQARHGGLSVHVALPLTLLRPAGSPACQIGVAAVIEERDGTLSYWALRHPQEKPDFHHRDGFLINWPLSGAAGEHRT